MKTHFMHGHRRLIALLLVLVLCMSLAPAAFAEQVLYRDPAEHWKKAVNRTNELDVNSVTTTESFYCFICCQPTAFTVWRTPEYTRDGRTALTRNIKYSDGTLMNGSGTGTILDGVPGVDSTYTGYHWTKSCCDTCGTINANIGPSDYSMGKNIYWLYDCDANFIEPLDDEVSIEYVDDTYHMVTVDGGTYCAFCYGTKHTHESRLERHTLHTDIIPQLGHRRFAIVKHCELCEYTEYEFVAAKSVVSDYYSVVDGQPHTLTVSDLSEAGVNTTIRYGSSADSCTLTSAPNYSEEGQYTVYYEITYRYQDAEMTENGVAYVWLRDKNDADPNDPNGTGCSCGCGCGNPNCDCKRTDCSGCSCNHGSCGGSHTWTLAESVQPTCSQIGYDRYICVNCGLSEKRDYANAIGHAYQTVVVRDATCEVEGKTMEICRNCGDVKETITPKGEHRYKTYQVAATCTAPGYTVRECKVCGDRHIEDITEVAGHKFVSYPTPPTCTTGGHILHICSVCGESFIDNYLPATGHSMDEGTVLTPAVCDHDGVIEYACVNCTYTERKPITATGHVPGPEATCTDPQLCAVCGAVLAHAKGHSFQSTVIPPTCLEMGHTDYYCPDCGFAYDGDYVNPLGHDYIGVVTAPTCTERGYTTFTCSRCGDSYIGDYVEATGHFWDDGTVIKDPTCTEDGIIEYRCTICGVTRLDDYSGAVVGSGHDRSSAITLPTLSLKSTVLSPSEPVSTLQSISTMATASTGGGTGHSYIGTVTAPTCTERGFTTFVCVTCGDTYVSNFTAALGHSYKSVVTPPTCTELGYTTYTCDRCGDSYVANYTNALGHNWKAPTTITPANCTGDGVMEYDCSRCEAHYYEAVSANGHKPGPAATCENPQTCQDCGAVLAPATRHNYKADVTAPTCTELGYTTYTCANCGDSYKSDYVREKGHSYKKTVTKPTCTEGGFSTYTCANCGDSYVDDYTDPLGHDWLGPELIASSTCNNEGALEFKCSRCHAHYHEAVSATGHKPGPTATCINPQTCLSCGAVLAEATGHNYKKTVTAATCTEMGYTTYTCANCGDTYRSDYTNPLGHSYKSVVTAPTCIEGGYTTYTCSRCGDSYQGDFTEAKGHRWDNGTVLIANACDREGVMQYACLDCGAQRIETIPVSGNVSGQNGQTGQAGQTGQTGQQGQTETNPGGNEALAGSGHNYQPSVTAPTCTELGFTTYTCADCGTSFKSDYVNALGHDYRPVVTAPTCTERGYTTYTCANCGDSYQEDFTEAKGHRMDEGKILTPGVCDHDGVVQYFCRDCDYMTMETIPATDHVPGPEATCTDPQVCAVCGTILEQAKGHSLQSEVIPATCLDLGHTHYFCEDCGIAYDSDYTLPLGHDYVPVVTEPSCLEAGYTTYTCSRCEDSYVSDYTVPLGHEWDEGTLIVDTSCNGEGVIDHRCVRCDYHYLEALSPEGHTFGAEATCTEPQVCTVCGAVLMLAKGHTYEATVTEPTCVAMGFTTYTCANCGDSYKSDYVEAKGHKLGDWIIDKEPTTTADGSRHKECEVCHEKLETERIEKLYLTAITNAKGEATAGEYLVTVLDTDTAAPVHSATVTLNSDGSINVRLPDDRLVDYADQTNVTVVKAKDKSGVPGMSIGMTDKYGNAAKGTTNKNGIVTLHVNSSVTDNNGRATFGYTDDQGNKQTLTVRVLDFESGRPIIGALLGYSGGKVTVKLPDGTDLDDADRISIVVLDNQRNPVAEQETTVGNDVGRSVSGTTDATGTLTVPDNLETERHTAYVNGYPDGSFGPENSMSRSEATAIFARLLAAKNGESIPANGATKFTDVPSDAWYAGYVAYLTRYGVVNGTSQTEFSPNKAITRAEFVTLAVRFFDVYGGGDIEKLGDYVSFNDVPSGYWASGYIEDAASFGWINGYGDGSFRAGNKITRAEVVTIVNRVLGRAADQSFINGTRGLKGFTDVVKNHWAYYDIMEAANTHTTVIGKTETWQK